MKRAAKRKRKSKKVKSKIKLNKYDIQQALGSKSKSEGYVMHYTPKSNTSFDSDDWIIIGILTVLIAGLAYKLFTIL